MSAREPATRVRRRPGARGWWLALVVGALVGAVGVTLLVTARRLPPAFSATAPTTGSTTAPRPSVATSSSPSSSAPSAAPAVARPQPFQPTSLSLPAFRVTAAVDPVFTAAGVLSPPDDPARVGWWGAGMLAGGSTGSTVIVGHVDGPSGPGALYRLVHTRPGDRVTVTGSGGSHVTYAVTALQYHGKASPLPASLFVATGPPRLVLISCGGTFDRSDDEYEDNVVVLATPV